MRKNTFYAAVQAMGNDPRNAAHSQWCGPRFALVFRYVTKNQRTILKLGAEGLAERKPAEHEGEEGQRALHAPTRFRREIILAQILVQTSAKYAPMTPRAPLQVR